MSIDAFAAYRRIKPILGQIFGAAGAQAIIQALGFVSSILIIRWTTPTEYGLYTIALSLQGALAATADAGIAANVMAQGGRVWQDRDALGSVMSAGQLLRRRLAIWLSLLIVPIGFFLLYRNYGDIWGTALIMVAVLISFVAHLPCVILEVPLKLHSRFSELLQVRVSSALIRMLVLAATAFFQPFAWLLVALTGLVQASFTPLMRRLAARHAAPEAPPSAAGLEEMKHVVRRSLPGAIYYSVHSQVSLWLLAILGVVHSVAELGALARLAAIGVLFTVAFDTVVIPRIAKLPAELLQVRVLQVLLSTALLLAPIAFGFIAATDLLLSLLGGSYRHLRTEFALLCAVTSVGLLTSMLWSINSARSFVPPWYLYPAIGTASYTGFAFLFGVSTPLDALQTQLATTLVALFTNTAVFVVKSRLAMKNSPVD